MHPKLTRQRFNGAKGFYKNINKCAQWLNNCHRAHFIDFIKNDYYLIILLAVLEPSLYSFTTMLTPWNGVLLSTPLML